MVAHLLDAGDIVDCGEGVGSPVELERIVRQSSRHSRAQRVVATHRVVRANSYGQNLGLHWQNEEQRDLATIGGVERNGVTCQMTMIVVRLVLSTTNSTAGQGLIVARASGKMNHG